MFINFLESFVKLRNSLLVSVIYSFMRALALAKKSPTDDLPVTPIEDLLLMFFIYVLVFWYLRAGFVVD